MLGHENLQKQFLNLLPKYKGLLKYNCAFVQKGYTTNTKLFCEELSKYLEEKQTKNCEVIFNREIESFVHSEEKGKEHLVTGVKLRGKEEVI